MSGDHRMDVVPRIEQWHAGPTAPRMVLGARLRKLREERELSPKAVGAAICCTESKISRMELGRQGFKRRDIADLLELYGVDAAERAVLLTLARQANTQGWWKRGYGDLVPKFHEAYIDLEQAAERIRGFENRYVHELLQTPDYARAELMACYPDDSGTTVNRRVEFRLRRQELLMRPGGPKLWVILDESVLHRPAGPASLMRAQFAHLLDLADLGNVTVQVLPFAKGIHRTAGSPISLLRLAGAGLPDVIYLEHPDGGHYPERPDEVGRYFHILNELGTLANTPEDTPAFLHRVLSDR